MKKYYIGLIVLALLTLGLTGFVLLQAASAKQDNETSRKAQEIADKLNSYTNSKGVPESLAEAGIKDVPTTITYTKQSSDTYEFCVTYKHASDGFDGGGFDQVLTGTFQRNTQTYPTDDYSSSYTPSSLYLPYTHKAGKDCQKVQAYTYDNNNYLNNRELTAPNYGTDYDLGTNSSASSVNDIERQTDIKALQGQLETFYALNGYYPTLANINDASWRKTKMKGLDSEALRDPKSTIYTLSATEAKNIYSYYVSSTTGKPCDNAGGNDCTYYSLQATLDNGTAYTKLSLN